MNIVINTDGAARGNPGPAAYAFVMKVLEGPIIHQESDTIGETTNNIAEYTGVLRALEYVLKFHKDTPHKIQIFTDSELMAKQLSGLYKVKNENLKEYFNKIKKLERELGVIKYMHVPRSENFIADKLANQALDRELV